MTWDGDPSPLSTFLHMAHTNQSHDHRGGDDEDHNGDGDDKDHNGDGDDDDDEDGETYVSKPNVRSPMCSVGYNSDTLSIGIGPFHWVAVRSDYLAIMMIMMMMMVMMMVSKRISNQNHSMYID